LLIAGLIVYGSLYPWQFHPTALPATPFWVLLHSWPAQFNRFVLKDIAVNVALYAPFGAACYLWLSKRPVLAAVTSVLFAVLLSGSMEMLQLFDGRRVCSLLDLVLNVIGAALGVAIAAILEGYGAKPPRIPPHAVLPLLLVGCWIASLTFPFMPDFSRHHLAEKIRGLLTARFQFLVFYTSLTSWLVAARLIESAFGKDVSRACLPVLFLVLPMQFFITGRTLTWTECAAAALAWVVWIAWLSGNARSDLDLAALSVAMLLFYGLAPFHFLPHRQTFSWIPFRALFSTEWESGFAVFLRKSFSYGGAMWLLMDAGIPLAAAAGGVASILAFVEIVQIYLPGHVAESTDPLQALILSWIFKYLHTGPTLADSLRAKVASR
jgi:VanZ family protein